MNKRINLNKTIFSFLSITILILLSTLVVSGPCTIEKPDIMIKKFVNNKRYILDD